MKKFNFTKNKIKIQFTDESIIFFEVLHKKLIFKFEKDIRSFKKWKFRLFNFQTIFLEEKTIEKFRTKFMKLL